MDPDARAEHHRAINSDEGVREMYGTKNVTNVTDTRLWIKSTISAWGGKCGEEISASDCFRAGVGFGDAAADKHGERRSYLFRRSSSVAGSRWCCVRRKGWRGDNVDVFLARRRNDHLRVWRRTV